MPIDQDEDWEDLGFVDEGQIDKLPPHLQTRIELDEKKDNMINKILNLNIRERCRAQTQKTISTLKKSLSTPNESIKRESII
jgi:hypothetical protein